MSVSTFILIAIVQPLVLVTLGAWLWHRATSDRPPLPDVAAAYRNLVTKHRPPGERPAAQDDNDELELEPPPFKA